jgi:hypothetical protein
VTNIDYGLLGLEMNLRSFEGGFVAAKKKSRKKPSSPSSGPKLTKKQYRANFEDAGATISQAITAVEHLEIGLKRIKSKLDCFGYPANFFCTKPPPPPFSSAICKNKKKR